MDEPTNHLDSESASKVISALNQYHGIGCIVTHDRSLLKKMEHSTLLFMMNRITHYHCPWEFAVRELDNLQSHSEEQVRNIQKEVKKIRREEQRRRESAKGAKKRLSKCGLGIKDRDARAKVDAARLTGKDSVDSRFADRLESRRTHLEKRIGDTPFRKSYQSEMKLSALTNHKKLLIELPVGEIDLDGYRFLRYRQFQMREGDKVAITGNNGIGKSTFVKKVIREGMRSESDYLYIPQEISIKERSELMDEISKLPKNEQGALFTIIKRLGSEPRRLIDSESPSPGEIRKLLLARAIQQELSLIIMDEPTNHLDLVTVSSLESALQMFQGALLFVSHDSHFVESIAEKVYRFEEVGDEVASREVF